MKKIYFVIAVSLLIILLSAHFLVLSEKNSSLPVQRKSQKSFTQKTQEVNSASITSTSVVISAAGEGFIGTSPEKPVDNPVDNVFHFQVNQQIRQGENVWIEYELNGVQDFTSVSHSINDQLSVGGYLVRKTSGWKKQKEQINASLLRTGDNVIRFSVPEGKEYGYQVKNIRIHIEKNKASQRQLVINQPSTSYYYQKLGYLQGFVTGQGSEKAVITVAGDKVRSGKGMFESLVEKPEDSGESWQVQVKATFSDGQVLNAKVRFDKPEPLDFRNDFEKTNKHTECLAQKNAPFDIRLASAELTGKKGDVADDLLLSVTALRKIDMMPLDPGMVNVTKDFDGYRFLPHGTHFRNAVTLRMAYDTTKIPDGYSEADIRTYYFNEEKHHWVALLKDTVLYVNNIVVSKTNHFTDMINAIIKVPESPETQGYTPTSMKDIKAANPAAGINLMNPPTANSMGTANVSYPIKIPAGRQGMQPGLAISYNSGGGNGWLGLGWDLSMPSITVETRWGVPHYDPDKESETYVMGGEQLSPVAHRESWVARSTSDKQFFPRVEGSFSKIIRHGKTPKDYWWEVTDKSGTVYFYGGLPGKNMQSEAVLADDEGNIAFWALTEIRDLNGNFVRYHYTTVIDAGVVGGTVPGRQLYPDHITYTGFENTDGLYNVVFKRDRQLNEPKRTDISISTRYGFKEVTADLLRKVEVQYNKENIRTYELFYSPKVFNKTLLDSIVEYDAAGKRFTAHEFTYYDEVHKNGTFTPFEDAVNWDAGNDDLNGGFFNKDFDFNDKASALSGAKSENAGGGMAVTVGPNDNNLATKSNTAGVNYTYTHSWSKGKLSLVDINGDGLPDKIMMIKDNNGERLEYRPQLVPEENGTKRFGARRPIHGADEFLKEKGNSHDFGIESNFGIFAGLNYNTTKSTTEIYFTDANGDGLIDIVKGGSVLFNHLDENGNPVFTRLSNLTPNPIIQSGTADPNLITVDTAEIRKLKEQFPLHDVVRMWQAPFNGTINISAPVNLIKDLSSDRNAYSTADGVRVAVQHNGIEIWNSTIGADDYSTKACNLNNISIKKGERIYFRVQSIEDGAYDKVLWNPVIQYSIHQDTLVDANNKALYKFTAGDDYILAFPQTIGAPINGEVTIEGLFNKPVCSDSIKLEILKNDNVILTKRYDWDSIAKENILINLTVNANDVFRFKVISQTNIDWHNIQWTPHMFYTKSADPLYPDVKDGDKYVIEAFGIPEFSLYSDQLRVPSSWKSNRNNTVFVTPKVHFRDTVSGEIMFTVKKLNELVSKQMLVIKEGKVKSVLISDTVKVRKGEKLFFDFTTTNRRLANLIDECSALIADSTTSYSRDAGLFTTEPDHLFIFGPMYRQWGQFAYNGNGDRASKPIDESSLHLDQFNEKPKEIDLSNSKNEGEMTSQFEDGGFRADKNSFIMLVPQGNKQAWVGADDLTYVKMDTISSSRMGLDQVTPENPLSSEAGGTAVAISKVTKSDNFSIAASSVVGGSFTTGTSKVIADYTDMNGDRFPDLLGENKIQYTTSLGGLTNQAKSHRWEDNHMTNLTSGGASVGGSFPKSGKQPGNSARNSSFSVIGEGSFNASALFSTDEAESTWMDINGDGLPDRVKQNGSVALNLGYKFAPEEMWGALDIRKGKSDNFSGGLGVNIKNYSIAAGIGFSRSDDMLKATLQDVNGDGLADKVYLDGSNVIVLLNTGAGFSSTGIKWGEISKIGKSCSTTKSANVAFTIGIPLVPPAMVVKLCFNPKVFYSQSFNRQNIQFSDVDGDGMPDYVSSNSDDKLTVSQSTIGKTNLLKSVSRPLKGGFELDYKQAGNTYDMPQKQWVLGSVSLSDGHVGEGADRMLTTFDYEDGYQDRYERTFYGFRTVKTMQHDTQNKDALYRATISTYKNRNYYEKGLPVSEELQDAAGRKYMETQNTYKLKNASTMEDLPVRFDSTGVAFPALIETKKYFYEGQPEAQKSTRETFAYGAYGNVTSYTDFGDPDVAKDDISSVIQYHQFNKYIVSVPKSIEVKGNGKMLRKRETSVDSNTGDITEIRQYLETGSPATYDMFYDKYGNLDSIIRPQNYKGQRMYFAYSYDDVVHNYVVAVRDAYGLSSSSTYEYRFGQVLSTTDINGQQTKYKIDTVGRITQITGPYELKAGKDYTLRFHYYPEASVPWAHTQHYDPAHPENQIETAIFIDGLGRVLQTKKDGALFKGKKAEDEEVMIVSGHVDYDAFGRALSSYYPVKENKGMIAKFDTIVDKITPTRVTYDVLDRTLETILPDGSKTLTGYDFENDRAGTKQFRTKVTDANGKVSETFTDVKGRQTAVKAPGDTWTSFVYDPLGQLIDATDPENNTTTSAYDMLGRRISRNHPDAGLTEYTYDLAGNMSTQTTANLRKENKQIRYDYDYSRLTAIKYPQNTFNDVRYEYGKAGDPYNRAGRIVFQEDATGAQEFFYGPLGEIVKNIRTIAVPGDDVYTFTTQWEYDTWNRLTKMTYPDGEELSYTYNTGGLLRSMYGKRLGHRYNYLTQLGYDKFENRVYLSYGNGTETTYDYEPDRRRLSHITATTSNGRKMMDNTYSYDKVNNILSLVNEAPQVTPNKKGGPFEYNYKYDDLYRLTHAEGDWKGATHEHRYELDMQYSPTGRILHKTQTHDRMSYDEPDVWVPQHKTTYDWEYKYEGSQPHAATHIGENTYTYDANGNQTGWTNDKNGTRRQILWDEENRMRAIADNGVTHHYIYDAAGERVIKSTGDGQAIYINGFPMGGSGTVGNYTMYVNPFMVVSNFKYTKHFYIEGQRIVSKLGEMGIEQPLLLPKSHAGDSLKNPVKWDTKKDLTKDIIIANFEALGLNGAVFTAGKSGKLPYGQIKKYFRGNDVVINPGTPTTTTTGKRTEDLQFYYHTDHLGSSNYITDASGEVYQHQEYFPFGETFIEERNDAEYTTYLFNGKELDEETGLYYYGARYYDPRTSMWQSVDSKAEKGSSISPYAYCFNNPIKLLDPNGMWPQVTHYEIIKMAFGESGLKLSDAKVLALQKGSDNADRFALFNSKNNNQADAKEYIHAMKPTSMSIQEAKDAANNWIDEKINNFIETGDYEQLGEGLHTLMDVTSPTHRDDNGNPLEFHLLKGHINKENPDKIKKNNGRNGYISIVELDKRKEDASRLIKDKYKEAILKREAYLKEQTKTNPEEVK